MVDSPSALSFSHKKYLLTTTSAQDTNVSW